MSAKRDFEIGDLVWAKMKRYPYWPGKIIEPPTDVKPANSKKVQHFVFFFGSENYAWIPDESIVHHSDEMLNNAVSNKKKSASYKLAIEKMSEESVSAPKEANSPVEKEKESPPKSPESSISTSNTKGKIIKDPKRKVQKKNAPKKRFLEDSANSEESVSAPKKANSPVEKEKESPPKSESSISTSNTEGKIIKVPKRRVQKKNTPQKRFLEDSANSEETSPEDSEERSPAQKLPKKSEDHSALVDNSAPVIGEVRVAIIRPLPEQGNAHSSTGFIRRDYFDPPADPPLNLQQANESILKKCVTPTKLKIGFIGLGMLGQRFVKNLLTSKHNVTVWNRTPEKCKDFIKVGAQFALTPADVVEKCDIIFCCVSGPDASKSLVFGNCGILSGLEKCIPGTKGYVELTTIDPTTSQEIAEAIAHKGGKYLEAMISGSRTTAEEGNLLLLCAGDRELFISCESCFNVLSEHVFYQGTEVGSGSKMNLILSMLMGTSHAALAEAMALLDRCNLSQPNLLEILTFVPFYSTLLINKAKAMNERNFTIDNSLKYQQKDLSMALSLANKCEQPMLVTAAANELFKHAKLLRYSDHDVSAVYFGAKY